MPLSRIDSDRMPLSLSCPQLGRQFKSRFALGSWTPSDSEQSRHSANNLKQSESTAVQPEFQVANAAVIGASQLEALRV